MTEGPWRTYKHGEVWFIDRTDEPRVAIAMHEADATFIVRACNAHTDLIAQLTTARRQNELMLATIRQLYDHVRAEQERECESQMARQRPEPAQQT